MRRRGAPGTEGWRARRGAGRMTGIAGFAAAVAAVALAAGCASSGTARNEPASRVVSCGPAKTAADVPVQVVVTRGRAPCRTAQAIEAAYAAAIRSGKAPGNGGGGPVQVRGWTCQGFATPVVLHTGKASKCVKGGDEILEILPPPSPTASASASA